MVRDNAQRNAVIVFLIVLAAGIGLCTMWSVYTFFRIDVPTKHIAVLTKLTGNDLENDMEVAPSDKFKGVQLAVLSEGRYFRNSYTWDWEVIPMFEVPAGKLGVRIRLVGDNLPYGEIIAWEENQKGIVPEVLRPGRYAINPYVEEIKLFDPITVPAGYKGVVTLLAAPMPTESNVLLVEKGKRGVQKETYEPGTYYVNPYMVRINLVDCRSQRFNLADAGDMGFPSKDGFWVSLDGIIEFRVKPEKAAEVFVNYNDSAINGEQVDQEIINKVILPKTRAYCRLRGSNNAGRDFINGDTRISFQENFQTSMQHTCDALGIEIIQALVTRIKPPTAIAGPIRDREVSVQTADQYTHQIKQQASEKELAIQNELVNRNTALVDAEQQVAVMVLKAMEEQKVAITKAEEELAVAKFQLEAAKDKALAITSRGKAEADIIDLQNKATAAGWKKAVAAFGGDGGQYANYALYNKLAPSYRKIMVNTNESPLMRMFESQQKTAK